MTPDEKLAAVRLKSMKTETGVTTVAMTDDTAEGVLLAMGEAMAVHLSKHPDVNYLESECWPRESSGLGGPFVMTVRLKSKPTPHELREKAEAKAAHFDEQAAWWQSEAQDRANEIHRQRADINRLKGEIRRMRGILGWPIDQDKYGREES